MSSSENYPPGYLEADQSGQVIAATTSMLVITTIALVLRLYARSLTKASRGWDEFLLPPCYLFLLGIYVTFYLEVSIGGLGRHIIAIEMENPQKVVTFGKILYAAFLLILPANALSRISVVALYLRIFTGRLYRACCWAIIAYLVAQMIATIIVANLECTPFQYMWDKSIEGGHCLDKMTWWKSTSVCNVAGDVMILVLPIPTIYHLQTSVARKMEVGAVFFLGSIGLFASCMRTGVFFIDSNLINTEPTWATACFSWTVIESGMYFFAACLVGLRPVITKIRPCKGWITSRLRTNGSQSKSSILPQYGKPHRMPSSDSARGSDIQLKENGEMMGPTTLAVTTNPSDMTWGSRDHYSWHMQDQSDIRVQTEFEVLRESVAARDR